MKKVLMKFLFVLVAVVGLTLSVSAQKGDDKKRPPKDPPKVEPSDKNRPKDPPKDDKPKKPSMAFILVVRSIEPKEA